MFVGMKTKPPFIQPGGSKTMHVVFEFDGDWTFHAGDVLRVNIGEKEANELLGQLLAELARIQKT